MKLILCLILLCLYSQIVFAGRGTIVLSGGGAEGDIGVTTDWSYKLYKKLIENGDVTGDKKINVVVISSEQPHTNFVINYFKSMGADSAVNLIISNKNDAFEKKVNVLDNADVLFIRGGKQNLYYQYWKDTILHNKIEALIARGGSIGGTSSGAMVISQYTMTGGRDFYSPDVLQNSHSTTLRDSRRRKSSGIHDDFLNIIPNMLVDTHCGESARLGRMMGVHAKIVDDYKNKEVLGVCIEEHTGLVIKNDQAQVYGTGTVHFLQTTDKTKMIREEGTPLVYTDIRNDALTDGWIYDLKTRSPVMSSMPTNTFSIAPYVIKKQPTLPFKASATTSKALQIINPKEIPDLVIFPDAYSEFIMVTGLRKLVYTQSNALTLLYKRPEMTAALLNIGTALVGDENGDITSVKLENAPGIPETSLLIYDCSECSYKSLSPYFSNQDFSKKSFHAPALLNLRLHAIDSRARYNTQTRRTRLLEPEFHLRDMASKRKSN